LLRHRAAPVGEAAAPGAHVPSIVSEEDLSLDGVATGRGDGGAEGAIARGVCLFAPVEGGAPQQRVCLPSGPLLAAPGNLKQDGCRVEKECEKYDRNNYLVAQYP